MTVSMIPMFVLWWNVEGILLKLGQGTCLPLTSSAWLTSTEAEVAHLAANYLKWLSIGIPGYGGTVLIKKYVISPFLVKGADTIDIFRLRD